MKLNDGRGFIRSVGDGVPRVSHPFAVTSHLINHRGHKGGRKDAKKGTLPRVSREVPDEDQGEVAVHGGRVRAGVVPALGRGSGSGIDPVATPLDIGRGVDVASGSKDEDGRFAQGEHVHKTGNNPTGSFPEILRESSAIGGPGVRRRSPASEYPAVQT